MRHVPLIILGFLALAACASRTPPGPSPYTTGYRPPRDENFNGGPNAMLLKYDANHDGSLTRAELAAGLKAEFDKYDTRHAGCLDADQVHAINETRIAQDQSTATPLQDWNQDGCVDLKEFSTTANSLFDELDRNGDGTVTPQEFNPRTRPGGSGPAAGGRRGGGTPGPNLNVHG
ncbi:MAG TPA: EF-hand domain-containing protein [Rhizomicrobium sp.]|nr:EF-hand domain-containing protein [Rhizomicrobium sp.]